MADGMQCNQRNKNDKPNDKHRGTIPDISPAYVDVRALTVDSGEIKQQHNRGLLRCALQVDILESASRVPAKKFLSSLLSHHSDSVTRVRTP